MCQTASVIRSLYSSSSYTTRSSRFRSRRLTLSALLEWVCSNFQTSPHVGDVMRTHGSPRRLHRHRLVPRLLTPWTQPNQNDALPLPLVAGPHLSSQRQTHAGAGEVHSPY